MLNEIRHREERSDVAILSGYYEHTLQVISFVRDDG